MNKFRSGAAVVLLLAMMTALTASSAVAATAPTLGDAASFAVLGGSAVTNTGPSEVHGDLGVSPGTSITGFPPGEQVPPTLLPHAGDEASSDAQADTLIAYNNLSAEPCTQNLTGQDLGGLTLVPGVYCFDSSAFLTGTLTLNAVDGAASVFVFKTGSTLITASGSRVEFLNGGTCNGVFWRVGSSATLGTGSLFEGTIVALAAITATTGADVNGRLLALNEAVTLDDNKVTGPTCGIEAEPEPEEESEPSPIVTISPNPTDTTPIGNAPTPTDPSPTVVGPGTPLPAGTTLSPTDIVFTSEPGATPTSTTTTSSDNPSGNGQPVTFTAVVTPTGSTATAQGTVTFFDGSTVLGSVPLKNGRATFTTSSLIPGDHPITAVFHGGPGLTGSISRPLTQKVTTSTTTKVVTTTNQRLVNTGADILPLGLSALTALLIGFGFLLESRRRARKEPARIPER